MIPTEFKIAGGKIIYVKIVDIIIESKTDTRFGEFNSGNNTILIAKKVIIEGSEYIQTTEDMERTFLHELGHVFQFYSGLDMDEMTAQAFSNFMYEYTKTKK